MIPILYSTTETEFNHNGIGRLSDCLSCVVTEERNGEFTLEMEIPITGIFSESIELNSIIKAKVNDFDDLQLFCVNEIEKNLTTITVRANHISYRLCGIPVKPFSANSLTNTFSSIESNCALPSGFTFETDMESPATFTLKSPCSAKALLGGIDGSILDVYGRGEYEWNNFKVRFLAERGSNNGVAIRYRKNLTGLEVAEDSDDNFNGAVVYWYNEEEGCVMSDAKLSNNVEYPYNNIKLIDATPDYEEKPSKSTLDSVAQSEANKLALSAQTYTISFVSLWHQKEYAEFAECEKLKLCDTVTVVHPDMGVSIQKKVIRTVYDTLGEQYKEITVGTTRASLADTLTNVVGTQDQLAESDIGSIKDFIIASGMSSNPGSSLIMEGKIYWAKYKSGRLDIWGECLYNGNIDVTVASPWGGYESSYCTLWGAWPVAFTAQPAVSYRITDADAASKGDYRFIESMSIDTRNNPPNFKVWRGTSKIFGHPRFAFSAIGRWK